MNDTPFFSIIVPNYNNGILLNKSLNSVFNQTFQNYELIFVDDCSTDDSVEIAKRIFELHKDKKAAILTPEKKIWNGGSRNLGVSVAQGQYLIFLDSDDWFYNEFAFQKIYDNIITNNYPDLVRVGFNILTKEDTNLKIILKENDLKELVDSCFVACWTKVLKKDAFIPFPENTLMEDVVQHIATCDTIKNFSVLEDYIVNYNRQSTMSCSTNPTLQNSKWESSMYRYYADLFDLVCKHSYCEDHRQRRLEEAKNNIGLGRAIQ